MPDLEERAAALKAAETRAAEMEHRYDLATLRIRDLQVALDRCEERATDPVQMAEQIAAQMVIPADVPMTEEQAAEFKRLFDETMRQGTYTYRIVEQPPLLTPEQVRYLLRECVTVVKPDETLVIRGRDWTPMQVCEVQEWMDREHESGRISFRVLAVIGDELAVVQSGAA
jgi:ribosomal protein L16 Arg81 hydroxylase